MSSLTSKGYTPCEYIESSGSQYIDTGFKPNQNTRVVMDVQILQNNSSVAANELYGARTSTSSKCFAAQYNYETQYLQFFYGNGFTQVKSGLPSNRDLCVINKNIMTFGGQQISRSSVTFQCDYNLYLLALNNAGAVAFQSIARLYSCQIYDNGTLIRDFKPCRNTSGVYGLFDEVNDVFYTTPSGSFTGNVAETSIKLSQSFRRRLLISSIEVEVDYGKRYLTIESLGSGNIGLSGGTIYYSKNGGAWVSSTNGASVTVVSGDKVRFKATRTTAEPRIKFSGTAKFNVYGNIMSLIHGDGFVGNNTLFDYAFDELFSASLVVDAGNLILPATTVPRYCYYYMFYNCTSLTTAPELPATVVSVDAYSGMFMGCKNLIKAPSKLPAVSTGSYGYAWMFKNCTSLTTAPSEISATDLANYACSNMFYGCTSLKTAPEILATEGAHYCFISMFRGCTSLITAPSKIYLKTMFDEACKEMFYNCTSLTTAPELLATKLYDHCCSSMFSGCTSLTTAPELPATTLGPYCYYGMFHSCTSLTTAPEILATTLADYCCSYMFFNCTSLTTPPELPATTLASHCYADMFNDCTSLTTAPELPATTLSDYCYSYMFDDCTSLTTAPKLPATTLVKGCYSYMFQGCIKLNSITMLATNIPASGCLSNWVYNVASSGTFVKHPDMESLPTGNSGIPEGWTVVNSDGSPVTGGGDSGESTTISTDWTVQEGNWYSSLNNHAWGYKQYTSDSHESNGSARLRCTFSGVTSITFNCVYNGENNYDYLTVGNLDSTCTRDSYGTTLKGTSGTAQDITFSCDSGTHYVEFCYSKDSSVDTQPDCAVVYIKNCS